MMDRKDAKDDAEKCFRNGLPEAGPCGTVDCTPAGCEAVCDPVEAVVEAPVVYPLCGPHNKAEQVRADAVYHSMGVTTEKVIEDTPLADWERELLTNHPDAIYGEAILCCHGEDFCLTCQETDAEYAAYEAYAKYRAEETGGVSAVWGTQDTFITKDSGIREAFSTGSLRDTRAGKGRYDLLPVYAVQRLAQLYERGAEKYGERNWEKGQPLSRYLDSALRHTFQLLSGDYSEDHAAGAAWNLLAFIETQHRVELGELPEELNDV